jgi:hypothetical protein
MMSTNKPKQKKLTRRLRKPTEKDFADMKKRSGSVAAGQH